MGPVNIDVMRSLPEYITKHARKKPDQVAMVQFDRRVTYKEFDEKTDTIAKNFLKIGLQRGDVISTLITMSIEQMFIQYAAQKIGCAVVTMDLRYKTKELVELWNISKPRVVVFIGDTGEKKITGIVENAMAECPGVERWYQFMGEPVGGTMPYSELLVDPGGEWDARLAVARQSVDPGDTALVIFTTGSTGRPKGALLTHENIMHSCRIEAREFHAVEDDVILVNLPPSHVGGQTEQSLTMFCAGGKAVLIPMFDARKTLEQIQKERVTLFGQIPAQYFLEWRLPDYDQFDLSSLRMVVYGGSMVPAEFIKKLKEMAPVAATGMGLTEVSGFCTFSDVSPDADPEQLYNNVGKPPAEIALRICDPTAAPGTMGAEVPRGEVGEACYSGPVVMKGYLNDPEATALALVKDDAGTTWLRSGDLGILDGNGNLVPKGRTKWQFKSRGYLINSSEIEEFLSMHEKIRDAVVVGVPHSIYGYVPYYFVVPADGRTSSITEAEIHEHAKELASYKRPAAIEIRPYFPLNRVNKTDVAKLRQKAFKTWDKIRDDK